MEGGQHVGRVEGEAAEEPGRVEGASVAGREGTRRSLGEKAKVSEEAVRRKGAGRFQRILGEMFGARRRARHANPPSADGERQSLYFAHVMCTDRDLVAGVARARLPMLQTWFPEWTRLGVRVARGREPRRRRRG